MKRQTRLLKKRNQKKHPDVPNKRESGLDKNRKNKCHFSSIANFVKKYTYYASVLFIAQAIFKYFIQTLLQTISCIKQTQRIIR